MKNPLSPTSHTNRCASMSSPTTGGWLRSHTRQSARARRAAAKRRAMYRPLDDVWPSGCHDGRRVQQRTGLAVRRPRPGIQRSPKNSELLRGRSGDADSRCPVTPRAAGTTLPA